MWQESKVRFSRIDLKNPENFEVLAAAGTVPGQRRRVVVLGCYLPPNYTKQRGLAALDYIENTVIELKRKYHGPQILVAGDFNQWKVEQCLESFADLKEKAIDEFFPLKTTRRKNTDLPWLNRNVIKKIEARKRLYWQEGGKWTAAWREEKSRTDLLVKNRKKEYVQTQKEHLLAKDANMNFFRHVKTFSRLEKSTQFIEGV